ncbi:MAG TPA: zf-HC2 domain-containing protein [Thermoanaerobaculia bacterium]|jgi:anti-sigma factor RsiW|nr:zf-HC2 domain-containing protein [Thermoanaerobaculia bacterium]
MNCSELITTFLADYFDGTLPPDMLADFEHHLDVCDSCVAYLRTYRETITMAAAAGTAPRVDMLDVPEELVKAILNSV